MNSINFRLNLNFVSGCCVNLETFNNSVVLIYFLDIFLQKLSLYKKILNFSFVFYKKLGYTIDKTPKRFFFKNNFKTFQS